MKPLKGHEQTREVWRSSCSYRMKYWETKQWMMGLRSVLGSQSGGDQDVNTSSWCRQDAVSYLQILDYCCDHRNIEPELLVSGIWENGNGGWLFLHGWNGPPTAFLEAQPSFLDFPVRYKEERDSVLFTSVLPALCTIADTTGMLDLDEWKEWIDRKVH